MQALAQVRLEPLNEALAAADPEGYRRVFIDSAPLILGRLAALPDQSALRALLERIFDLNITLIAVTRV